MPARPLLRRVAATAVLVIALACGGGTPLAPADQAWAGKWVASDGTYIHVFLDGGGTYKGSNTSIEGGSATVEAGKLTIGLGPIKKDFRVDAPPTESGGQWAVTLDGVVYTRE